MLEYTLVRTRRKTVCLRIHRDLSLEVRAPLRMPQAEIDRFVRAQGPWAHKHLARMAEPARRRAAFCYADGQTVPCHGLRCTLGTARNGAPSLVGDTLLLPAGEQRPAALQAWLRAAARECTGACIQRYAPLLDVQPAGVKITSAATRWGSCSATNRLCFSYRIACLPEELLAYVVVHELAHIREHNHSARFWAVVGQVLPDYAARRQALREFQEEILF